MTAITSLSFSAVNQSSSERNTFVSSLASRNLSFEGFRLRSVFSCHYGGVKASNSTSRTAIHCMSTSTDVPPTVSETKSNFLKAYKRPIPSIYNTVLQELIVQQHLMRYKKTYLYDPVFGLGLVTVYDQLMEGYPSDEDREAIFQAYIKALKEDPEQYRIDAKKLEEWARAQTHSSLVDFSSKEGEIEGILKGIAERAASGNFSYSRFFAVGLFRLLELSNASEPTVLEKLCSALNINKRSVDRDLDVYRGLLSKLVQAKELLKEYVDREKKKQEERAESQKANEIVAKCLGDPQVVGQ
ncbi:protein THYLAKOID FORMATION1 [Populus alba x Populus x berolinensis]|nr:protein THYLAKOID FORMATION1 [Populus alba x Populus x berolinensis]